MARFPSRPRRWYAAVAAAQAAISEIEAAWADADAAMSDLRDIQSEYSDWRDNMPEGLTNSALAEKLDEVVALDLDIDAETSSLDDLRSAVENADGADLPRGFGND